MKFGSLPIDESEGAILAHSASTPDGRIKKGRQLSTADIAALKRANITTVIAAKLSADDVIEDEAAARIAAALTGDGVRVAEAFTGRANVYAEVDGVFGLDRDRLIALNRIDEGLTVASLPAYQRVKAGQMIATIKIITFALDRGIVDGAVKIARSGQPLLHVAAFKPHDAALILTDLPGVKTSLLDKRVRAMRDRVETAGSRIIAQTTVPHTRDAVSETIRLMQGKGADPILIFGASAIVDREDVIPGGLVDVGGDVLHLGMPVDPGNLLMLGRHQGATVIGVPSCASSPKLNGLDWILERTLAGIAVTDDDITEMAVGGLLTEIPTRPQPRASTTSSRAEPAVRTAPRIAAVILASGRSTRMGTANKLLEDFHGKALVRHVAEAALASTALDTVVVTGHDQDNVRASLAGLAVRYAENSNYAEGLSTTLAAGIAALADDVDGAVILLADMPLITAELINQLIAAFAPHDGRGICVPFKDGRRGNPVLWGAEFFPELLSLTGDTGARHVIAQNAEAVAEVDVTTEAIFTDVDTPEALASLRDKDGP